MLSDILLSTPVLMSSEVGGGIGVGGGDLGGMGGGNMD